MKHEHFKSGYLGIFVKDLFNKVRDAQLPATGAMLAYFLLFSVFPFLIFLLNLVALIAGGYESAIFDAISYLPSNASSMVIPVVRSLMSSSSGTLMSISLVVALWAGSNGIIRLMHEVNIAFGVVEPRGFISERLLGIFFTIALALLLTLLMLSNVFGNVILGLIHRLVGQHPAIDRVWNIFRNFVPLFFIIIVFILLYRISPNLGGKNRIVVWDVIPGAVFTSLAWVGISLAFAYYVDNFGNYDRTYGSLGGIIVMMFWLYLSSIVMVLGAYVSSSYIRIRRLRQIRKSIYGTVRKSSLK